MNVQDLIDLRDKALGEVRAAQDAAGLEAVRIAYLGRKSYNFV